jgi:glucose/arabinose dehydrogenase
MNNDVTGGATVRTRLNLVTVFLLGAFFSACSSPGEVRGQYVLHDAFPALSAFSFPVEMVHAGDGTNRLFVMEQRGKIFVFENSATVSDRKLFLDISDRVSQSGSETGLLGLAFHPNYSANGLLYVNYTRSIGGQLMSFVSQFQVSQANPDSAVRGSETILLTVNQPFSNHNGGCLRFGMDGYLYIGLGDGGSAGDPQNNAQNRTNLLGKILRIDVNNPSGGMNYGIPADNPFVGNSSGYREEIFAYGLRNPWRFSFDRLTGTLWAGGARRNRHHRKRKELRLALLRGDSSVQHDRLQRERIRVSCVGVRPQ